MYFQNLIDQKYTKICHFQKASHIPSNINSCSSQTITVALINRKQGFFHLNKRIHYYLFLIKECIIHLIILFKTFFLSQRALFTINPSVRKGYRNAAPSGVRQCPFCDSQIKCLGSNVWSFLP